MENSRQDPAGSQEEIKGDVCERVYPGEERQGVCSAALPTRGCVNVCVCVRARLLPPGLEMELSRRARGLLRAIRSQPSWCCPWLELASARLGCVSLTDGELPKSAIFKGIARPASLPTCERELTFSLSPPLSHSSLLPWFFFPSQKGGMRGMFWATSAPCWGGGRFLFSPCKQLRGNSEPKVRAEVIPSAACAQLSLCSRVLCFEGQILTCFLFLGCTKSRVRPQSTPPPPQLLSATPKRSRSVLQGLIH